MFTPMFDLGDMEFDHKNLQSNDTFVGDYDEEDDARCSTCSLDPPPPLAPPSIASEVCILGGLSVRLV